MRRKIDAFDVFNFTQWLDCCVFPSLLVMDREIARKILADLKKRV